MCAEHPGKIGARCSPLTWRPYWKWEQLDTALYSVSNPSMIFKGSTLVTLAKKAPRLGPSANLLLSQGGDTQSIRTAARDVTICRCNKGNGASVEPVNLQAENLWGVSGRARIPNLRGVSGHCPTHEPAKRPILNAVSQARLLHLPEALVAEQQAEWDFYRQCDMTCQPPTRLAPYFRPQCPR